MTQSALRSLYELTGIRADPHRVSDLGFAVIDHSYEDELLARILHRARELRRAAQCKFLGLEHLRAAHVQIPEVERLMRDRRRLAYLSEIAEVELEPYQVTTAASHINFYSANTLPIAMHTDGAAFVELIPLIASGSRGGGATLIFRGPRDEGELILREGRSLPDDSIEQIPQHVGRSVLLQGRMLLHGAETIPDGERITLVLAMRSIAEPWKDDNSLMRLMLDDDLEQIQTEWLADVVARKLPAFKRMLDQRSPR
jgi:hypothetical protein